MAAWHLPGGLVGPPARWAATSNVEGGSGTDERARSPYPKGEALLFKIICGGPEFLVTPLLMGPVCLNGEDRFEKPDRACTLQVKSAAMKS